MSMILQLKALLGILIEEFSPNCILSAENVLPLHRVPPKARMENGICISCWWMPTARFNSDCHTCKSRPRPSITKKITPTGKRSHPTRMVKDCAQNTNAPNYISHNLLQGKGHRGPVKQVWVTSLSQTTKPYLTQTKYQVFLQNRTALFDQEDFAGVYGIPPQKTVLSSGFTWFPLKQTPFRSSRQFLANTHHNPSDCLPIIRCFQVTFQTHTKKGTERAQSLRDLHMTKLWSHGKQAFTTGLPRLCMPSKFTGIGNGEQSIGFPPKSEKNETPKQNSTWNVSKSNEAKKENRM